MLGRFERENMPGRSTSGRAMRRSIAFALVLALCIALILCFPVAARDVSGTAPVGEDGFREASIVHQYLAEGTTYGGMETWVVLFNPGPGDAIADLTFYADNVEVAGPQDVSIPKGYRKSLLLNSLVPDKKDVSTKVVSGGSPFLTCERAVYGPGRVWAHECIAAKSTESMWVLAEGTTCEGMETWVVVFNPGPGNAIFDLTFYTDGGEEVAGPQNFTLPEGHRHAFLLNSLVPNKKDVSTIVSCDTGKVVCERAVYGPGRAWAHASLGVTASAYIWYLAEGTTCEGMETWVVVFNPYNTKAIVDLTFYTESGEVIGPQDVEIDPYSRKSFLLNSLVPNKRDVATKVSRDTGAIICERAVYGLGRVWAHESIGSFSTGSHWYLAEGTTCEGMQTWVVVFNPGPGNAIFDLTFYTDGGEEVAGPQNFTLPEGHRHAFLLNSLVPNKKDVSTIVSCDTGEVICERAVYGPGRAWAHESLGAGYH